MTLTASGSAVYLDVLLHGAGTINVIAERSGINASTVRRICLLFDERGYFVQTFAAFQLGRRKPELPLWAKDIIGADAPLMNRDLYRAFEKRLKKLSPEAQSTITSYPPFEAALKVYGKRTR